MTQMTRPTTGVTPYLTVSNARAALELYRRAFGAEVLNELPADDGARIMHSCLRVNGGMLFVADAFPEHGCPAQPPQGFALHLQVDNVDAVYQRAAAAGLEATVPVRVEFWGDKYGQLRDAFGVTWSISGPNK